MIKKNMILLFYYYIHSYKIYKFNYKIKTQNKIVLYL